ncbi:MAG: tetratricopeptide repeat protein, partial [Armatimonadetes bacterium]|nr:tetratricopeptide repeat protein [Armatimonadota bacterium]
MDAQQPRKRRRPGSALLVVVALFVVGAVVVWPRIAPPRAIGDASAEVIKALLAEDWTRVATLLDTVTPQTPSPVLRLLKAHACLALNRNNESLGLLLAASTDADLQAWHTWTAQLAKRHGTRAVVHYLVGDALARLRQWDSAVGALTDALRRHPNDGMALNARGIAYAAMGNLDEALVDIEEAAKANPSLAEVHTNRGALNIQRRLAPEAALASFRKALEHSPDYVLALNGRGAIGTVLNQFDEAETDLRRAAELAEGDLGALLPVIVANGLELARARDAALANMLARAGGAEPGTEMDVSYAKNH